ncbi:MAG: hypothetical protein ACRCYV_09475 [Aeromonas sp.]
MRYQEPFLQSGLTKQEAHDTKERYLQRYPQARISIAPAFAAQHLLCLVVQLPRRSVEPVRGGWRGYSSLRSLIR